jgi:hypothetical protein
MSITFCLLTLLKIDILPPLRNSKIDELVIPSGPHLYPFKFVLPHAG